MSPEQVVADWPELTDEQIARLAVLLSVERPVARDTA